MGTWIVLRRLNFMVEKADQATSTLDRVASPRILVVEDDVLVRMMLVEILTDEGYDIVEAGTGDEALGVFDQSIALLLTDYQLPGNFNGRTLAERVRTIQPRLPVLYMSGNLDGGFKLGQYDMAVAKPYQIASVCAAVRTLLAR